jgi:serine/threonine protein kinase
VLVVRVIRHLVRLRSTGCVLYECLTGRVPFEKDLDAAIIWAHVEETSTMPTALAT